MTANATAKHDQLPVVAGDDLDGPMSRRHLSVPPGITSLWLNTIEEQNMAKAAVASAR